LKFELEYLTYLKEHGFPHRISAPTETKNGEFILKFKGSCCWISEYVDGKALERFDYPELDECAKMMATYHRTMAIEETREAGRELKERKSKKRTSNLSMEPSCAAESDLVLFVGVVPLYDKHVFSNDPWWIRY
jgi:hypothetical protein